MSLTILTVAEPVLPALRPDRRPVRQYGPDGDPDEYVTGLAERWREAAPGVSSLVAYDPISPAQGVRSHLDKEPAGLVAVTTHARSGWQRLLLGAVAASIVQVSVAPVLVVPPDRDCSTLDAGP
jgi:nucleotide-binding universal stress UspA family protein